MAGFKLLIFSANSMSNFRGVNVQRSHKGGIHLPNSLLGLVIIPYMGIILYGYLTDITLKSNNILSC